MKKLKKDYPCDLKLWLIYFLTIIFLLFMQNKLVKKG